MYESFYCLKEKPFNDFPHPGFFYMSKKHKKAFEIMNNSLSEGRLAILTGDVGSGKTALINYFCKGMDCNITNLLVDKTGISTCNLLQLILEKLDTDYTSQDKKNIYEKIKDLLINEYFHKKQFILIIDEAQNLQFETLQEIETLLKLNDVKIFLIKIILIGHPELKHILKNPRLQLLGQKVSFCNIEYLDQYETGEYVKQQLLKAKAPNVNIFQPEAIQNIFIQSGGIPRLINQLCDMALMYGFNNKQKTISKCMVDIVASFRSRGFDLCPV